MNTQTGVIRRYRARLGLALECPVISLGEGATPLVPLPRLGRDLGVRLYVKCEGGNPTGSFKDRGMTVAVSQACGEGLQAVVCASTGNTSASAAAYAAHAGLRSIVLIPEGNIARGKLAQAVIHGALVVQLQGNFDDGMRIVRQLAEVEPIALVNSINPWRLQGQKTAAFEIIETLGRAPEWHCLPVGNAGNISACWMGYTEDHAAGHIPQRPHMCGYQARGAAPLVQGAPVEHPETLATAIRIGRPQSWDLAQAAVRDSGGWFAACSDDDILAAQRDLACEGIFCEPASAASVAGLRLDRRKGRIPDDALVVCTLTGHGLKDPDVAMRHEGPRIEGVAPQLEAVREALLAHA